MDYLKLNLLPNDAERTQTRVANPRQPLCLCKTRTSGAQETNPPANASFLRQWEIIIMTKIMDYLKLNLLQNDVERIQAWVANPRQHLWLCKTRTSWGVANQAIENIKKGTK